MYHVPHTYEGITSHTHMNVSYLTYMPEACLTHTHESLRLVYTPQTIHCGSFVDVT